jgi:hypothetical protein
MSVTELALQIRNQPGQLVQVTSLLADAKVNIRGITASSTGKYGWVRMVVDKPKIAQEALEEYGFTVEIGEAVAVQLIDEPGALDRALHILAAEKINLDYIYTCVASGKARHAVAILGVQTPSKVEKLLNEHNVATLDE